MKRSLKGLFLNFVALTLAVVFAAPVFAQSDVGADRWVQTDPVQNTYRGRPQAVHLIAGLRFTDLPANEATRDAIVRAGAMEVVRPDAPQFRPNEAITVQDAIVFSLRAAGLSNQAMALGQAGAAGPPLGAAWADGYLQLAVQLGIIGAGDIAGAATTTARREDVAGYLVGSLQSQQPGVLASTGVGIVLQRFTDWNDVSPARADAVESLLQHNVIHGNTSTAFGPDSTVNRAEMAQIIRNLDGLHYGMMGLTRVRGIVGQITTEQRIEAGASVTWHRVYVRRADGLVDVLEFTDSAPGPQPGPIDAVVLRGGTVTGLRGLQVNDEIEYLVSPGAGTVWYVQVRGAGATATPTSFTGRLEFIDFTTNEIAFWDSAGGRRTFIMADGFTAVIGGENHIRFPGADFRRADDLPRGTYYEITLVGNIVTNIAFIGQPVVVPEVRGIVIDNNYWLGSITILDANRQERSFSYIPGVLRVQRRVFYDMRDVVGGVHEMFPRPMPRETTMESVIPGDIVVFWVDDNDPLMITSLSAAENVTSRWGRVREFTSQGRYFDMMLEFDNGRTAWYTVVSNVLVLEGGRPVSPDRIQIGDWVRILVNQAVVAPGVLIESVREVVIDSGGHHIGSIVMGYLAGFNQAQNEITIQHAQELTPAGWRHHSPIRTFNINNPNIRYYHDGNRVSLAHINRYLQRSDATVYMAVENHFAGERVTMLSVRSGRDILLEPDFVLASQDNGFMMLGVPGFIQTDPGTIVVRNGRLVEEHHISTDDWLTVSMNGHNRAAVVEILPPPATSGVQIVVGRVRQVFPFRNFVVNPTNLFTGFGWTPNFADISFAIDHNTIFMDDSGVVFGLEAFLGFIDPEVGNPSVINDDFLVVVEGGRAARVIRMAPTVPGSPAPGNFADPIAHTITTPHHPGHLAVRGNISTAPSGGEINIHNTTFYTHPLAQGATTPPSIVGWNPTSAVNPVADIITQPNTIIIDRNQVISVNNLQIGQQILVLSPRLWTSPPNVAALPATIILVER